MPATSSTAKINKFLLLGIAALLLFLILSVSVGGSGVTATQAIKVLFGAPDAQNVKLIVFSVRLPRALGAVFCGSALAVSGLLLQAALDNSLASPGIMGVNHGAGLLALVASAILPFSFAGRTLFAFVGAILAALGVFLISKKAGVSRTSLILSGVAVSGMLTAMINLLIFLKPALVTDRVAFSLGSLSSVTFSQLVIVCPVVIAGILCAFLLAGGVDLFALGDETAQGLGLHTARHRIFTVLCASVLAAAAVSVCGLISFVGLIVPNMVRMVSKHTKSALLLCSVWGGGFLLFCDFASRLLVYPYEMPVGILLSLFGGPFFIYMLMKRRRRL
ncbi:MAG: iron ABC transporter permease [Clostridia bacterium]|nr:iron ABC transporter permease [Clostridia bacterium]